MAGRIDPADLAGRVARLETAVADVQQALPKDRLAGDRALAQVDRRLRALEKRAGISDKPESDQQGGGK